MGRPASDVREQIVDAALSLLRTSGVRAVVQTRVAKAAGVPQGHLTYYFPKKADLLVAVARRYREETTREIARFFGPGHPALPTEERIVAVVRALSENPGRTRALLGLALESESEPVLREELLDGVALLRQFMASVLGRATPDEDVDLLLATFWGLGVQNLLWGAKRTRKYRAALLARVTAVLPLFLPNRPPETPPR